MINLNEISVNDKNPVFNNGKAGEAVVTISVEKKPLGDTTRKPDYNLVFTDKEQRTITEPFWYLDATGYAKEEDYNKRVTFEATKLKHFINVLYGDLNFPPFNTPKEMLDWCMETISKKTGTIVKGGFTFGTPRRINNRGYLGLKRTFPMLTANLDEAIEFGNNDLMERPQPSTPAAPETGTKKSDLPWDQ